MNPTSPLSLTLIEPMKALRNQEIRPGLLRSMRAGHLPYSPKYIGLLLGTGQWRLVVGQVEGLYAGFFIFTIVENGDGPPWMELPFGWINNRIAKASGVDLYVEGLKVIEGMARDLGCSQLVFYGQRRGYPRRVTPLGFKKGIQAYWKPLQPPSIPS